MTGSKAGPPAVKHENFFVGLKNEVKKIVWPSVSVAFKNSGVVLFAILFIGTIVFLLDKGFGELFKRFMEIS
ncbi:MAG: preprotein translocase subunit SecE [Oscillospiraceae bacterium]|jgi:preprotein translocase SecE subunit|nr:preprotein translocase subunit SecE [Oscillospiraceae bacterium]